MAPESPPSPLTRLQPSPSTEALLADIQLPPGPTEVPENYDAAVLEHVFQRLNTSGNDPICDSPPVEDYSGSRAPGDLYLNGHSVNPHVQAAADVLRRQHANLERRLQPFLSSVLSGRSVRLHLFALPYYTPSDITSLEERYPDNPACSPVASQDVVTATDGSFKALFQVTWSDLCQHHGALHIAFGDRQEEHELFISAQLLPLSASEVSSSDSSFVQSHSHQRRDRTPTPSPSSIPSSIQISLTHSPIRVISDIDDTVKLSNVPLGARAVFRSVFVKELHETIIPGMGEWYTGMWSRGIRFHYVVSRFPKKDMCILTHGFQSNGPFEILPLINEFLQISQLPPGLFHFNSYHA